MLTLTAFVVTDARWASWNMCVPSRVPNQNTSVDLDMTRAEDASYAFGVREFIDLWGHISAEVRCMFHLSDCILTTAHPF